MSQNALQVLDNCPGLEQSVVRLIQQLRYEHLDAVALAGVSRLLRDQIALQVGTAQMPWSRQLLDWVRVQHAPGNSLVAASGLRISAADAAFLNAAYGHGFEYDDAHPTSASHPGSCVIPAALAIGEELGSSLEEVITAMVAGYEVYTRIGMLAAPELLRRGYQPHAVLSNFGAAAVAAKLRGFDAETTLHALAIALSHAGGTTEYTSTGGSVKRVHAGIGTRNGIVAAAMAAAGITGPRAFLSGNKGFLRTFVQREAGEGAEARFGLDRPFEIGNVWLKAYCACYCTHAYIDALTPYVGQLQRIREVHARIHPAFNTVVGNANANAYSPANIEHVQFSLPVQIAFTLLGKGNGYAVHRDYLAGRVDMGPVLEVARGIRISESPELEQRYPGQFVADLTLTFSDGSQEQLFVEQPIGSVQNPMSEAQQDAKFMELTSDVLGEQRARALLATLRELPLQAPVSDLTKLFAA